MRKACIVLPTYNEAENIEILIPKIFRAVEKLNNWEVHILVVDSLSPDKTAEIVKKLMKKYPRLHLLVTAKEGLGKAYIKGFNEAIRTINPYLFFEMDADLSHDPAVLPNFFKQIELGADFVIGSRYIKGGSIPKDWGFHRKIFSFLGNMIVRLGFMKLKITDWTSGYRAIKSWLIKSVFDHIKNYSGYVFQIALLDQAIKRQAIIKETPISFQNRKKGVSKINFSQYIFQVLIYVFLNSSFIKYVIVGFIGFFIDFALSYTMIEKLHFKKESFWLVTAISAEMAIISNFILNNYWSFSYKKLENKVSTFIISFLKFNFVSLGALIIQAFGIQILTNFFGPQYWYIYKVLIIGLIIIPYSYTLYNKFIWKNK
ncbi:MAG: glycosyltransferase family 2 protein [Microgenomates group bacterium]|nr:glycosyltransferase family 2 protein [Microgenomates group bacterium]